VLFVPPFPFEVPPGDEPPAELPPVPLRVFVGHPASTSAAEAMVSNNAHREIICVSPSEESTNI
jgi:hypothetical protein